MNKSTFEHAQHNLKSHLNRLRERYHIVEFGLDSKIRKSDIAKVMRFNALQIKKYEKLLKNLQLAYTQEVMIKKSQTNVF